MFKALVDLVLAVPCVACGAFAGPLCPVCARHALHTEPSEIEPEYRSGNAEPGLVVAAGAYEGALRSALVAYKERGRRTLVHPLGSRLAAAVARSVEYAGLATPRRLLLVPVPSSAAAARARGGDHLVRLARRAVVTLSNNSYDARVAPVLTMRRAPADSVGLGAAARRANLVGAFAPVRDVAGVLRGCPRSGTVIVLVDDIVTTGATLAECYRAAKATGFEVLGAATVAATPRPDARHARFVTGSS